MKVMVTTFFLTCLIHVHHCQSECQQRVKSNLYPASDRVLLNHVFKWQTESSPVICGRDCSMNPHCASFNYYTCSHVCQLSNATHSQSPDDFIELQGVAYYDDYLETPSLLATDSEHFSSCLKLYQAGSCQSGIYTIYPAGLTDGVQVYCDMETDGGGWIVFQMRKDGSVDFYRKWAEYQSGFGDLSTEFWLGNDILRNLTDPGQWQLMVNMADWDGNTAWASYDEFAVSGDKYTLHVGSYDDNSSAGDSLAYHNGHPFSTKDQDNDGWVGIDCAQRDRGAWWFKACCHAHLNGHYYHQTHVAYAKGLVWVNWIGYYRSLKTCSMKIREVL
ncbi:microfibril-associated glycoprotein 4-like [Asterias amurensis]|uniref:microfibril-associated glycoprotein 4-like n=1 Tax=Asterias amurensis TaxID=7602 RepID=UPI003AB7C345